MAKHGEGYFVLPALKVLYNKKYASTSEIKDEIREYADLSDEDLSAFASRKTRKEPAYRQVVGNLISHRNKTFFSYVNINDGTNYPKGTFSLNEAGIKFVEEQFLKEEKNTTETDDEEKLINIETSDMNVSGIDSKFIDYVRINGIDKRPNGNNALKETIIEINGRSCEYGRLINKNHGTFKGKDGKNYMVAHHLIPMSARIDFFPRNLDRASNLICLCSTCHDCIHYGSVDERKKMLKMLYEKHIEALNDEQIYISFEELFNKYYS